jgi:hypothetical protein
MEIQTNEKGSRHITITDEHLQTLQRYSLLSDLLDSNGIVDESVLQKLRLNTVSLLASHADDTALLALCRDVLFHDNMKAFGLHQLILLYLAQSKGGQSVGQELTEEEATLM